jgi:hypothetical protein
MINHVMKLVPCTDSNKPLYLGFATYAEQQRAESRPAKTARRVVMHGASVGQKWGNRPSFSIHSDFLFER